jgi:hypothetical protein
MIHAGVGGLESIGGGQLQRRMPPRSRPCRGAPERAHERSCTRELMVVKKIFPSPTRVQGCRSLRERMLNNTRAAPIRVARPHCRGGWRTFATERSPTRTCLQSMRSNRDKWANLVNSDSRPCTMSQLTAASGFHAPRGVGFQTRPSTPSESSAGSGPRSIPG